MATHLTPAWPRLVGAAAFAASLALVPAGVTAQDGPEGPVMGIFAAISEKRFDDLGRYICPEFADSAGGFDLGSALTANLPAGIDPQLAIDALSIAVTGPSGGVEPLIYVLSEDAASTTLGIEATITVSLDPADSEPFVRALVENAMQAQGMELSAESIEALRAVVSAQVGDEISRSEYVGEVALVTLADDGVWRICGGSIVESDTLPVPSAEASPVPSLATTSSGLESMAFADYVAALEAFSDDDPFAGMSDPPTRKEVLAGLRRLIANGTTEQERLEAVIPEPCYTLAHGQVVAYWQASMNAMREVVQQLKAASSLAELGSIVEPLDEALYQAHPLAYIEPYVPSTGFRGSPFNILAAIAACDETGVVESPAP
jgi:hypothetical protein